MKQTRDTSEGQSKGRHNNFRDTVECPSCKKKGEVSFKAEIGPLEWRDFKIGDELKATKTKVAYAPAPECEGRNFWGNGVGACNVCRAEVYARIDVRENRFSRVNLVDAPTEKQMADFLTDWGFLHDSGRYRRGKT